jgi:hypothetical protein
LRVNTLGVQLTALTVSGRDLLARVFNVESESEQQEISVSMQPKSIEAIELDGRVSEALTIFSTAAGWQQIRPRVPRFGIRTLRFADVVQNSSPLASGAGGM